VEEEETGDKVILVQKTLLTPVIVQERFVILKFRRFISLSEV
jgi:hypothetical protein